MSYDAVFKNLPLLTTEDLIIRPMEYKDIPSCNAFLFDYETNLYWGTYDPHMTQPEIQTVIEKEKAEKEKEGVDFYLKSVLKGIKDKEELQWVIELKNTGEVVGEVFLFNFIKETQGEVGYRINKNFWGQGIASQAMKPIIDLGFSTMGLNKLVLRCFTTNPGSKKVAEKLGFTLEGLIREGFLMEVFVDHYVFGYLKRDYLNTK